MIITRLTDERTVVSTNKTLVPEDEIRNFVAEKTRNVYIPSSVYRIQLNYEFPFSQAQKILPFLEELGIEAVYCSPYFQSSSKSPHGYNITDPNKINPEIGSESDFEDFCAALEKHRLKQVLDLVPNHMGIRSSSNRLWMDVLENGPSSVYAHFFDINWSPLKRELKDKVLLPVLGDYYGTVLENQEIVLEFSRGSYFVRYHDFIVPVSPKTYALILEHNLEELQQQLGPDHRDFLTYQSVIKAFKDLPSRSERNPAKKNELTREKEIAKERLRTLAEQSELIHRFIQSRVEIFNGTKGDSKSFDGLDNLLNEQAYRLAFWKVAAEEINYRKFFDVVELAAIRVEDPSVFEFCHQLTFRLLQEGKIHGLRIDHPDGLYSPGDYLRNLQVYYLYHSFLQFFHSKCGTFDGTSEQWLFQKINEYYRSRESPGLPLFVVVEKILDRKETLPENWNVHGTVGYEFLNILNGIFIREDHQKTFDEIYENFIGYKVYSSDLVYEKKKMFAQTQMASEINNLASRLNDISEHSRYYRDFTLNNLTLAIQEVIACFPVYRTYVAPEDQSVSERDEHYIHVAIEKAKGKGSFVHPEVFDFLRDLLLLRLDNKFNLKEKKEYRDFILRLQQVSSAIMAKGFEDTVFYVNNRFISLNEVGGDPGYFGYTVSSFHKHNADRLQRWPCSFIGSSTHDSKRGEDVRARLNAISEFPEEWRTQVAKWSTLNKKHKTMIRDKMQPDPNTEYFIYQTLVGAWPNDVGAGLAPAPSLSAAGLAPAPSHPLVDRLWNYLLKSTREAKVDTSWVNPNPEYEAATEKFVRQILAPDPENCFLENFLPFQKKISTLGMLNSLSTLVLECGAPGVLSFYQGNELWNYVLVDPDNRRPVDFELRSQWLAELKRQHQTGNVRDLIKELARTKENGKIKLYLLWKQLNFRKQHKKLFMDGTYVPLKAEGKKSENVIAYLRKLNGDIALIAAGRFFGEWMNGKNTGFPWEDTALILPEELADQPLRNLFSETQVSISHAVSGPAILLKDLFELAPVALATNLP